MESSKVALNFFAKIVSYQDILNSNGSKIDSIWEKFKIIEEIVLKEGEKIKSIDVHPVSSSYGSTLICLVHLTNGKHIRDVEYLVTKEFLNKEFDPSDIAISFYFNQKAKNA